MILLRCKEIFRAVGEIKNREAWLFFLLVALFVFPVWLISYLPTSDGPLTIGSAYIMKSLLSGECPRYAELYAFTPYPPPNLFSHWIMTALLSVFSPETSERVLISGLFFSFCYGFRYWITYENPARRWPAYLVFCFVYNGFLYSGLYNFLFSIALFFWITGYWLRHESTLRKRDMLFLLAGTLAMYITHLFGLMLSLILIGVLFVDRHIRRDGFGKKMLSHAAKHLFTFLPSLALIFGYLAVSIVSDPPALNKVETIIVQLLFPMFFNDLYEDGMMKSVLSISFFICILVLVVKSASLLRSPRTREWQYLSLVLLAALLIIPTHLFGGWFIIERLIFSVFLIMMMIIAQSDHLTVSNAFIRYLLIGFIPVYLIWHSSSWHESQKNMLTIQNIVSHIPDNSSVYFSLSHAPADYPYYIGTRFSYGKCLIEPWQYQPYNRFMFPVYIRDAWNPLLTEMKKGPTVDGLKQYPYMTPEYIVISEDGDSKKFVQLLTYYERIYFATDVRIAIYRLKPGIKFSLIPYFKMT
jgi:hypothetical protein